jgi:predicted ATP-dependent serine protease
MYECVACLHQKRAKVRPLYCDNCGRPETYSLIDNLGKRDTAICAADIESTDPERYATGDESLDSALLGGFVRPSTLTAFGAAGVGKSRSCIRWATKLGPALLVSLEMPTKLAVLSARSARANLQELFVTESEIDWQSEAEACGARVVVFDSFHYSQRRAVIKGTKIPLICFELAEWAKATDGIVFMISHENKKGKASGETDIMHWPDYLFKFTRHGQTEAKVIIEKARYAPAGAAVIEI